MITLYTTETCPRCKVLKTKLEQANIEFEITLDISKLESLGILQVPMLEMDNGEMLDFNAAIKFLKEIQK